MFSLSNEEKTRLQKLNQDKALIFALKKLFLSVATKGTLPSEVQTLAAERIAIDIIQDSFHQLEVIQPANKTGKQESNLV